MLIQSGKGLDGPWAAIEFYSGQHDSEEEHTVHRVIQWFRRTLKDEPYQLLFPVKSRGPEGITLFSPCLWARTKNLKSLVNVGTVPGIEGIALDHNRQPIPVEDQFVQGLIQKCREAAESWSAGLEPGSFVRVLMGQHRMLCGRVISRSANQAVVLIAMRSRTVMLRCPVLALQTLKAEPKDYFCKEN